MYSEIDYKTKKEKEILVQLTGSHVTINAPQRKNII